MAPEATRVTSPNQQSIKPSMASRLSGKQEEENQRRPQPSTRAWGTGVNPITQKFASPAQSNGAMGKGGARGTVPDMSGNLDRSGGDTHSTVLAQAMGQLCTFITKEGAIFVGLLAATKAKQAETYILCRMVRTGVQSDIRVPQKSVAQRNYVGQGPEHIVVFTSSQLTAIIPSGLAKSVRTNPGKGFMTDTQISGNAAALRERKLVPWSASPSDVSVSLDSTPTSGEWDQFKVNQEKFGVTSDYDESHYTTVIDKSNPLYAIRERQAALMAAEIEGDSKSNAFSEQRGTNDEGYTEEDLYSGVRRAPVALPAGQANRYIPPSRRIQQPANGKEEFADPAILSAQMARKQPVKETKPDHGGNVEDASAASARTGQTAPSGDKEVATKADVSATPVTATAAATITSAAVSSAKPTAVPVQAQTQKGAGPTSRGLPADVRTAFKNFANLEKLKVQDNKRRLASQDKAVKVNDLKKFAKNFKLTTPVPKDLLPILAKDEVKQNEIVKKAQEQVELGKQVGKQTKPQPEQKAAAETAGQAKLSAEAAAPVASNSKPIPGGPKSPAGPAALNTLTDRLEKTRQLYKNDAQMQAPSPVLERGGRAGSVPGQTPGAVTSPVRPNPRMAPANGGIKLSGKASEFKPNVMAKSFQPGGNASVSSPSTKPATTRPITPHMPQPRFLREAKARDALGVKAQPIRAQIRAANTAIKRETKQPSSAQDPAAAAKDKQKDKDKDKEGAQPKLALPFRERVDWLDNSHDGGEHLLPGYKDSFASKARGSRQISHPASPGNPARNQQHMHYPMQNGTANMHPIPMAPQQMPPPMHAQQAHFAHGRHYDDHHMRPGMQPYPGPSPRVQNVYPSPMPHAASMGYPQGGYMAPGPHGVGPRQYSNGPGGMPGPHMQAPMMVHQPSGDPYMQQPMMPVQPGPPYQVAGGMYPGPPQPNGFPSPGRGAPPMMPSGSHQGHGAMYTPNSQYAQPVYHHGPGPMAPRGSYTGQPHYPQSPYQQHQYPARTPSHGYAQPHQAPVAPAQPSPAQPSANNGEEAK